MSHIWTERKRRTNQLVRAVAHTVLEGTADGDRFYALFRLTWITRPYEENHTVYIRSTKIPALGDALGLDLTGNTLEQVAAHVAEHLSNPDLEELVCTHTGFTNFYKAYRNSARAWIHTHIVVIRDILRRAYHLESDADALQLGVDIAALPGIPKANHPHLLMRPEYLLTPLCFALDSRVRFPILNGARHVQLVLRQIGAADDSLANQIQLLVNLIGQGGVHDAADLDQLGVAELNEIVNTNHQPRRQLLTLLPEEGEALPLKDEEDVRQLQQALEITQRRVHNRMTNQLYRLLNRWTLLEGRANDCRFDILVKNYNRTDSDLLLEVKSSVDPAQIRMAIGQVFAYWHRLVGPSNDCHTAIVLPTRPDAQTEQLLNWLEIGLLWFEEGTLHTSTEWLEHFVTSAASPN